MALTKLLADLDNVQELSDKPNEIEGLTPDQLKAKFDEAGNEIKTYINDTLTSEIDTIVANLQNNWGALTATFTYASADAPTFVMNTSVNLTGTLSVGMKLKLTQTTTKYFFITAITASTITLYGGTDYTLANAAISNVFFSTSKSPQGFPTEPLKWAVRVIDTTNRTQSNPTLGTWYNVGSLSITVPIGSWIVGYCGNASGTRANSVSAPIKATLSTSSSAESEKNFSSYAKTEGTSYAAANTTSMFHREEPITVTTKTPYYLLLQMELVGGTGISWLGSVATTKLYAFCAYL